MLRVLDLFSGIGGFSLGLERTGGFETVAFCEIEEFPRKVLAKHWPDVPIHRDVRKLKGVDVGPVDVICGGYPCQPFSTAGQRRGAEDDRHLWPQFSRLVDELRPAWVIGENVAGHISMGLDDVLSDLEGQGYSCRTFVIPACAVDAPHRRDRCWTVAHGNSQWNEAVRGERSNFAKEGSVWGSGKAGSGVDAQWERPVFGAGENSGTLANTGFGRRDKRGSQSLADADDTGLQRRQKARNTGGEWVQRNQQSKRRSDLPRPAWIPEPDVGRVANGVPNRVDRLKALGNAVVPQIPEMIGYAILEAERMNA